MTMNRHFGLYHETFLTSAEGETFFHRAAIGALRSVDKVLGGRRECRHDDTPHPIPDGTPGSPLHLVPSADEEASGRWEAVRPLHLPEVRLPAHDPAWPETTQPRTLTGC